MLSDRKKKSKLFKKKETISGDSVTSHDKTTDRERWHDDVYVTKKKSGVETDSQIFGRRACVKQ